MTHPRRMFVFPLVLAFSLTLLFRAGASNQPSSTGVFLNEIHYDNTGTDTGEAIEVAGPAGSDLTGWSIVLYNGSTSLVYDTDALSGVLPDQQNGFGTLVLTYPTNGIQNGSPDGIALVDAGNVVVQFLSYEGVITALDGPAAGQTSTDIGVSETGSEPVGQSLQLTGTGSVYEDFAWSAPAASTFGAVNTGQTFTGGPVNEPVIADCGPPLTTTEGTAATTSVSASDADGIVVDIAITSVTPSPAPGAIFLSGLIPAGEVGGTATADMTVDALTPAGNYTVLVTATNNDETPQTGSCNLSVVVNSLATIMEIQGTAHKSTLEGLPVQEVPGIVTALASNGFYMQDPLGDGDIATSDGIFVFTSSAPTVSLGDSLSVDGTVSEFYPGGYDTGNLATTELVSPAITVVSSGTPLPEATVIGNGGRVPPAQVIDDDATGDVETTGTFDPADDGIDFYESLEGMRVKVNDALVVGPTNLFGEIVVVGDSGANAGLLTPRGGIVIQAEDFNPERILLDDAILQLPEVNVGDTFASSILGVLDYSFGNFNLRVTEPVAIATGDLSAESAIPPVAGQLSIASFNVENLDPTDDPSKFEGLASVIVGNLQSPDIIAVEEIQDNNGATDDAVVDASDTYNVLSASIQAAGGPTYEFREIAPLDDQDGGEPGGNIRVGFLFRTDRGLTYVDRPGGDAVTPTTVSLGDTGVELSFSPGRIDPTNSAFADSRKPLAGEFISNGQKLIVIANHFNSKGGDDPLFGRVQPPVLESEAQRIDQAQVVNDFVDSILTLDPGANVVVLGDLNDFQFSAPITTLEGGVLTNLHGTLLAEERYSYVFQGNSQILDHILFSTQLMDSPAVGFDIVHANAEFAEAIQHTDHDPVLAYVCTDNTAPTLEVSVSPILLWPPNHRYVRVTANVNVSDDTDPDPVLTLVSVTSDEPDEGLGGGDRPNDIVIVDDFTFKLRAERGNLGDGRIYIITYQAADACGNTTIGTATVSVPRRRE